MDGGQGRYELRARTVTALEQAAAGRLDPATAAVLLSELRAIWTRERRWRNAGPPIPTLHVAGPVIACRNYVRSCPGFIVDRRQTCSICRVQLVRGKWAVFFDEGAVVEAMPGRSPILNLHRADRRGVPCARPQRAHPVRVRHATRGAPPYGFQVVDGELHTLPAEQTVVDVMHELRSRGLSYREIADDLNQRSITARRGGRWHAMTVRRALSRHAVTDDVQQPSDRTPYLPHQAKAEESGVEMERGNP